MSEEWFFAMSNKGILQQETSFLQRVTMQRVTSEFYNE